MVDLIGYLGQLVDAETFHADPPGIECPPPARSLVWHSKRFQRTGELPKDKVNRQAPKVHAFVSAGRWCVWCPWCPASEYASRTDHRFMCSQCHNNDTYTWIPVTWPSDLVLEQVEKILLLRPNSNTRNWLVDEPIENLIKENEENLGIPTYEWVDLPRPPREGETVTSKRRRTKKAGGRS